MRNTVVAWALLFIAWGVHAQQALELISLRHASAEQVLPVLRPLVEPGGVLTAHSGQLVVRASQANIAEIRRALEAIDRPRRRLEIVVRFDDDRSLERESVQARGSIGHRRSHVEIGAEAALSRGGERSDQRLQVLEGGRAVIATGAARPFVQRQAIRTPAGVVAQETIVMQEAMTGVEVTPRLAGDSVTLDVAQRSESFGRESAAFGAVRAQDLVTSVSGRLGEWIELGSIAAAERSAEQGIGVHSRREAYAGRRIWVKVEELAR
jgi:type II secretory pathway component GspD/PulD (secretin)